MTLDSCIAIVTIAAWLNFGGGGKMTPLTIRYWLIHLTFCGLLLRVSLLTTAPGAFAFLTLGYYVLFAFLFHFGEIDGAGDEQ